MVERDPGRSSSSPSPAVLAGLALFAFFAVSTPIVWLYTDYLWFAEVGQSRVLVTRIVARLVTGLAMGLAAAAFAWVNVALAQRLAPRTVVAVPMVEDWYRPVEEWFRNARQAVEPVIAWVLAGAIVLIGLIEGAAGSSAWSLILRYANRVPFGEADPLFGQDIGVYVFELPLWRFLQEWLLGALVLAGILAVVVHLLDGAIRWWSGGDRFAPHVKAHISVLLALIALDMGWGYWLDRWMLLYSPRGQVTGASYTDVHAQLPAYNVLVAVSVAVAVLLFANIRNRGWRLPIVGVSTWVIASVALGGLYPTFVQQIRVAPNELASERPFIERNMDATRRGFAVAAFRSAPFAATTTLTARALAEETATVSNVRLWDPTTVARTFAQLQEIRLYYDFLDVDVDRYAVGKDRRVVLLSARELDTAKLPDRAKTWVNEHLVYTHGYGVVMSPASRVTGDGLPDFLMKDIPPESADPALRVRQPAIYFGEVRDEGRYVVVGSQEKEFDYPKGTTNAYTSYAGKAGIPLSKTLSRLAFAWRFGDLQLAVSSAVTRGSKLMFRRNIVERARTLAPFLVLDQDPYPVLLDGRIVWVLDAYTVSDRYPYSEMYEYGQTPFNYVRNSVKIVTDAYDGTMTFYVIDEKDPIIAAWRRVFPTLFADGDRIPARLRPHLRYPELMFLIQADVLRAYHMTDVTAFYSKEDLYVVPRDVSGAQGETGQGQMPPYYVLMKLPQDKDERFIIMLPYTPNGKDNMVAWLAADSDPAQYGRLTLFTFPKKRLIFGPAQIEAKLNQDPRISSQLTLWNQQGSRVLRGNMLVIPVKQAVVYVQPIYLSASQSQFPQLEKVIVAYGDRLVMEDSLTEALTAIFGETDGGAEETTAPPPGGQPSGAASVADLIRQASERFAAAEAAQRRGDWATYGREIAALKAVLARLQARTGAGR